jgi:hypothetical protein
MRRTAPSTHTRMSATSALVLGAAVVLAVGPQPASAQGSPGARGIDTACRDGAQHVDRFTDVDRDDPHAGAIDCLWAYGTVQGRTFDTYEPRSSVTRQQVASFAANSLREVPDRHYVLPDEEDPDFTDRDTIAPAHRSNVASLQEAGIVRGYEDGTYRPGVPIDRAQMASFLARSLETATGEELPRDEGVFDDVDDGAHEESIEKLAAIGVVEGREDGTYRPDASTSRAQMASFVARSLDFLAAEEWLVPLSFQLRDEGAARGLTDVEIAAHDGFDRVTFELDAGEGTTGWDIRYVDEAVAHGSGEEVDVEGDAILRVTLKGMALPPSLEEDVYDGERVFHGGAGIVEVVDVGTYEGYRQLYVGTAGLHPFAVDRIEDPLRIHLDVAHG